MLPVALVISMSGCGLFDAGPALSISLYSEVDLPPGHVFEVTVARDSHRLQLGTDRHTRFDMKREAPRTGELDVAARLLSPSGDILAETAFPQRYRQGSNHWVSAWIGTRRPIGHCIGSLEIIEIAPPMAVGADTLFVMYGSLPHGAVC